MATELMPSEFGMMKEQVWKLASRVLLLEGFIKQQFGEVFWQFCEDQVKLEEEAEDSCGSGSGSGAFPLKETKPSLPVLKKLNPSAPNAGPAPAKKLPPPPPLSLMKNNNNNHQNHAHNTPSPLNNGGDRSIKSRNFLPKSLAPKPRLLLSTPPPTLQGKNNGLSILKENHQRRPALPPAQPTHLTRQQAPPQSSRKVHHQTAFMQDQVDYGGVADSYYQGESEESEEDVEGMYGDGGYLAAELVSATLCTPEEEDQEFPPEETPDEFQTKKIRLSYSASGPAATSASSSSSGGNGAAGRQMRPNPCHARCQNRCHDIWTDGDRMGVFQTYWALPTEEERREFVASRIERVDMATKRTEFSNFRTCTFKYYLPHPDNPWVQVCKNFFLATIDEKRSYIEKIAQSVKGEAGEKVSAKNIPFRRRNQMQRSIEENYSGWMQQQQQGLSSYIGSHFDEDQDQGDEEVDEQMTGMEMEELGQD